MLAYKYLGTFNDNKLNFEANCESVCKKGHQRWFWLGKLSSFNIDWTLFYRSFMSLFEPPVLWCSLGLCSLLTKQIVKWFSSLLEGVSGIQHLCTLSSYRMADVSWMLNYAAAAAWTLKPLKPSPLRITSESNSSLHRIKREIRQETLSNKPHIPVLKPQTQQRPTHNRIHDKKEAQLYVCSGKVCWSCCWSYRPPPDLVPQTLKLRPVQLSDALALEQ